MRSSDSLKGVTKSLDMDCTPGGTPLCDIYVSCGERYYLVVFCTINSRLRLFYSFNMSDPFGNISDDNLRDAKSSKLAVMIFSNEFFLSKNTMVELSAVFDAGVKILPVFFELSIQDLSDKEKIQKWQMRWEEFASEDSSINVSLWGHALQRLQSVTGFVLKGYGDKGYGYYGTPLDVLRDLCEIIKLILPQPQGLRHKSGDLTKLPATGWSIFESIQPTSGDSVQIPSLEEALKIFLQSALDNLISKKRKVKVLSKVALTTLKTSPWAKYKLEHFYSLLSHLHPESHRRQILVELERHNFSLELGSPEIELQELYNLLNTNDRLTCFVLSGDHLALVNCVELLYKASLTVKSLVTTDLEALLNWLKAFVPQADRTTTRDAVKWSGIEHLLAVWLKPIKGSEKATFFGFSFNGSRFAVDYPCEGSFFNLPAFINSYGIPERPLSYDRFFGDKSKIGVKDLSMPLSPKMFLYDDSKEEAKHLSMPLSPKIKNKDIQEHSSEISGHDQTTSSHLPESDPNLIVRGFGPTYSREISDHDQTTSSHLPDSGTESLIADGINDCKGVWIRFELNGQNPQITVGAQYLNIPDIMEFFFESLEDMVACVGVGLCQSKVILDENLIVTIQQLESDEWNSSEKLNGKPMFSDRDFDLIISIDMSSQQEKKQVYVNVLETSESSARKYGVGFDGTKQFRSCETYGGSHDEDFCPLLYKMALFALNNLAIRQHPNNVAATGAENPMESFESNSSSNNSNLRHNLSNRFNQENGQEANGEDQGGNEGNGGEENYTTANGRGNSTPLDMDLTVRVIPLPNRKVCSLEGIQVDCSSIGYHLESASTEPQLVFVFSRKQGKRTISISVTSRLTIQTDSSVYKDSNSPFRWYHDRISISLGCNDSQAVDLEHYSPKISDGKETTGGTRLISSTTSSTTENVQVGSSQVDGRISAGRVLEVGAQGSSSATSREANGRSLTENYEEPSKVVCNGFTCEEHSSMSLAKFELLHPELKGCIIGDIHDTSQHGKALFSTITPKVEGIWCPSNEDEMVPYIFNLERFLNVHRKNEGLYNFTQVYEFQCFVNHAMTHLKQGQTGKEIVLKEVYFKPPPKLPGVIDDLSHCYNDTRG